MDERGYDYYADCDPADIDRWVREATDDRVLRGGVYYQPVGVTWTEEGPDLVLVRAVDQAP